MSLPNILEPESHLIVIISTCCHVISDPYAGGGFIFSIQAPSGTLETLISSGHLWSRFPTYIHMMNCRRERLTSKTKTTQKFHERVRKGTGSPVWDKITNSERRCLLASALNSPGISTPIHWKSEPLLPLSFHNHQQRNLKNYWLMSFTFRMLPCSLQSWDVPWKDSNGYTDFHFSAGVCVPR